MTTRQRTVVFGTLLALALLGIASMPVAWAMPAQQLGTVPTRTPTPGPVTNTPVPPPTSAPVVPTATGEPTAPVIEPATATVRPTQMATRVRPTLTQTATPTSVLSTSVPSTPAAGLTPTAGGTGVGDPLPSSDDVVVEATVADSTQPSTPVLADPGEVTQTPRVITPVAATQSERPLSWTMVAGAVLFVLGSAALLMNRRRPE